MADGEQNYPVMAKSQERGSASVGPRRPAALEGPIGAAGSPGATFGEGRGISLRSSRARNRVLEHLFWIVLGACIAGALGAFGGYLHAGYIASARLALGAPAPAGRLEAGAEAPRFSSLFAHRLLEELGTPEFIRKVAASAEPPAAPRLLQAHTALSLERETGRLEIAVRGEDPRTTVKLANCYGEQALQLVRDLCQEDVRERQASLDRQMAVVNASLATVRAELTAAQRAGLVLDAGREFADGLERRSALETKITSLRAQLEAQQLKARLLAEEARKHNPALTATREALSEALTRYTEEHPKVKALRAALAQMETSFSNSPAPASLELGSGSNSLAAGLELQIIDLTAQNAALQKELESLILARDGLFKRLEELSGKDPELARLNSKYRALKESRDSVIQQQNALLLLASQGLAGERFFQPARIEDVSSRAKALAGCWWGLGGGLAGGLTSLALVLLCGPRQRIRSRTDLEEATGLPMLASLGDLQTMSQKERETWAFETLSVLKASLRHRAGRALVCGFTSSTSGEGKSTWIHLLAEAASRQGYSVVVASHQDVAAESMGRTNGSPAGAGPLVETNACSMTPPAHPGELTNPVLAPASGFPVRVALADWIWNWQYRDQFEQALRNWSMIDNVAVFVELPSYSTPAGVMMAETVPNLVWLCGQEVARASKTRSQLATLRRSQGGLAGAVLNQPKVPRAGKWRAQAATLAWLALGVLVAGAEGVTPTPPALTGTNTNLPTAAATKTNLPSLSVTSPDQMADWQRRLTLGPGDVLDISLYGQNESGRPGLIIGPDGRLNYLEVRDFTAAGFTVDELRAELEKALAKYHLAPQVVINPVMYRSKRYYLLGSVNGRGAYMLDRPVTIIEAIARGKGFPASMHQQNVSTMVDLGRSFLVRRGADGEFAKVPVDFEALFVQGDLSQNLSLAPDDYLFFPPIDVQEVYVVGEVRSTGAVPFTKDLTALGAIAARGGFTERAWQKKILIVRGSLRHPELVPVDASDILHARRTDLRLANRDIIYVHMKPWAKPQELLERAAYTFVNSVTMGYVNYRVMPYIP
jgi:protein involved in polysaccharide export with SLBB domain